MSKYWNLKTLGIEPYVAGEQPKDGQKVIKLNTNENPYSPSPKINEVLKNFDIDTLRTKIDELEKAAQAMSEAMYQQQAQQQANAGAGQAGENKDDVVDADFKAKE